MMLLRRSRRKSGDDMYEYRTRVESARTPAGPCQSGTEAFSPMSGWTMAGHPVGS